MGGYTRVNYRQEFLIQVENDIRPLLEEHWEEIALNKDKIKLNPDWDAYHSLEEANALKIFTAREEGRLVGYFVVIVRPHLHYKDHLFATNDVIYLHPSHRKGRTGIKLVQFAEKCLREDGVSVLIINTKIHRPFDLLMRFLKFNFVERVYSKYIGE
jgi:GNAT superfamily N-acetyltransferase